MEVGLRSGSRGVFTLRGCIDTDGQNSGSGEGQLESDGASSTTTPRKKGMGKHQFHLVSSGCITSTMAVFLVALKCKASR